MEDKAKILIEKIKKSLEEKAGLLTGQLKESELNFIKKFTMLREN